MDFKLKILCKENNLNCLKLEKCLQIPNARLNKYYNKEFFPDIYRAIIISNFFKCSLDYITGLSPIKLTQDLKDADVNLFFNRLDNIISNEKSQVLFFKNCQIARTNLSRWKNKQSFPRLETLYLIAQYSKISLDYLVGRTDEKEIIYDK